MIFTPENIKRLENVTVITFKTKNRSYEVAAVPNRLYEYKRNKKIPIGEIVHTTSIFTDISKGEIAKKADILKDLKTKTLEDALVFILDNGVEKKDRATREYENESIRKSVKEGIFTRVRTVENELLSAEEQERLLKRVEYSPSTKPIKVQINDVIKKAIQIGYTRRTIRISISPKDLTLIDWTKLEPLPEGSSFRIENNTIHITDDLYGRVYRLAQEKGIQLVDEIEKEEQETEI
ncbi:ribosome maturation protein SDO1 [Nematocida sp. AWRm80]|nr:ribosome maturation protein SDO1 [Nematocida sp. AWRm80]